MPSDALWVRLFDLCPKVTVYYPCFSGKERMDDEELAKLIVESTVTHIDYPLKKLQVIVSFLEDDKDLCQRLIEMRHRGNLPDEVEPRVTRFHPAIGVGEGVSGSGFWNFWRGLLGMGDQLVESVDATVASAVMADLPDFGGAFVCFPGKAAVSCPPEGVGKMALTLNSKEHRGFGLGVYRKYQWAVGRVWILEEITAAKSTQAWTFANLVRAVQSRAEVTWLYDRREEMQSPLLS